MHGNNQATFPRYGQRNPGFARRAIERVRQKMQPAHVWELQLGGPDVPGNLNMLHNFTNWHVGTQQLRRQLRPLKPGTCIKIDIEGL